MKNLKWLVSVLIITAFNFLSRSYAVTAWTLKKTKDTADHGRSQVEGDMSILDMISLVNDYLRFAIGFFCFVFMIWNGYQLISTNGDGKAMDSAKKGLLGSGIGLAICLLAYIIVNLAVRLFA